MANRSIFPINIDAFIEFHDLTISDVVNIQRYQELRLKTNRTSEEETEMNNLLNSLRDKIITAEDWNKFCDCVVNMEVFIRDNVVGFINTKQSEMQTYVDNAVNSVNTTKDNALIAIEQKKNNIIEYLDGTTAGQLRNDIGIMGDLLTTNKNSLVDATNEVLGVANSKAPASHTHTKADISDFAHNHSINEITNLFNTFYAGATTNSGNNYSVTVSGITSYQEGLCIAVKINADSTGAATININGLGAMPIKKANGTDVTNLKANGIYTMRYNGTNFILQGEGASGNATASDLLSGKTATTDAGEITGIMLNNGGIIITPSDLEQTIPQGYHDGTGKVKAISLDVGNNILVNKTTAYQYGSDNLEHDLGTQLKVNFSGNVRVKVNVMCGNTSTGAYARVKKNGVTIYTSSLIVNTSGVDISVDTSVNPNDIFTFTIQRSSGTAWVQLSNYRICANLLPFAQIVS